jgi:hypothetical protein
VRRHVLLQVVLSSEAYARVLAFRYATQEFGPVIVDRMQVPLTASVASEGLLASGNRAFEWAIVLVHMLRPFILLAEGQVLAAWFGAGKDPSTIAGSM